MKDIKEKNNRTRHGLYSRLLALLLTLALCMGMMPVSALAAEEESAVTLNLEDGNIVIEPDGYTQEGSDKVAYTGAYILTGEVTDADTPMLLKNSTDSEVTYDITLDNISSTSAQWCTAILMDGGATAGITLNLTNTGTSAIYAYNHAAITNGSGQPLTVNMYVRSGRLTLGNRDVDSVPRVITGGENDTLNFMYDCTTTSDGTLNIARNTTFVSTHYTDNGDGTHSLCECDECGLEAGEGSESHSLQYEDNGDGTHTVACSTCDYSVSESHNNVVTDTEDGHSHTISCQDCGIQISREPHTLEGGEITAVPGESEAGVYEGVCTVCGETSTSAIAPDGGYWICLTDSEGNGWNGASLSVYLNGTETSLTLEDKDEQGYEQGFFIQGSLDDAIRLVFHKGYFDTECSVELYAPGGRELLYSQYGLDDAEEGETLYISGEADYGKVEEAVDAVPDDLSLYTSESVQNLLKATGSVIYYLPADEQEQVDAYGAAILEAVGALELCGEGDDLMAGALCLELEDGDRLVITSTGYRWDNEEDETAYVGAYSLTTDGNETYASVLVESGAHFIVLDDLNLTTYFCSPIALSYGSSAWVYLEGASSLTKGFIDDVGYAGLNVVQGSSVYICGSGSLYAGTGGYHDEESGYYGAGIGASGGGSSGNITICGGDVTAVGLGTGIGGSIYGSGGEINISGGTVTATGIYGAGIGGGVCGDGGEINISGGTVEATGWLGAGIGGGIYGSGGEINISGGTVTATSELDGAGIGGGPEGDGGEINISGGTVTASGIYGAGIGSGFYGSGGEINISGGMVEASGTYGAGIGGGYNGDGYSGDGGEINISGGTVTATGEQYGAGIGGGYGGDGGQISISGGTVTAASTGKGNGIGGGCYGSSGRISITGGVIEVSVDTENIIGDNYPNNMSESEKHFVIIDSASVFSDNHDAIYPAPKNLDGELVFHKSFAVEQEDGYTSYTLPDGSIVQAYVKDNEISLYLPLADYGLVDAAIERAEQLDKDDYVDFSGVEDAIAAVVRDLYKYQQDDVDAMAQAIDDAIDALIKIWTDDPATESGTGSGDGAAADTTPIAAGQTYSDGNYYYRVTSITDMTAEVVGQNNTSITKVQIYDTVVLYGENFTVTAVAAGAFKGNKNITSVTMKKNLVSIGANAFSGCTKLKTVTIGSTVLTGIGANAFSGCTSLKKVTIKSRVLKSIGKQAFKGDKKLTRITLKTTKLKSVGKKALSGISAKCVIRVPKAKKAAYTKLFKRKGQKSTVKIK